MVEHKYSPVFISHATEDEGLAKAWRFLIRGITDDEIKPWYSSYILAGDDWRNSLSEALEHAQIILAIITPGSNERPWVHYEVGFAKGQNKKIIPVLHFLHLDHPDAHSHGGTQPEEGDESVQQAGVPLLPD